MKMTADGFKSFEMRLDNRVIPSDCVNNDCLGEQRERDNVCENEKGSGGKMILGRK